MKFAKLWNGDIAATSGNRAFRKLSTERIYDYYYVSLGDSIAAGHTINDNWSSNYGEKSQYGVNGNKSTAIVTGSYTDLIGKELKTRYGDNISVMSFARSGDTVADLMAKLNNTEVKTAIEKANLVTICIGANDILEPAMSHLEEYINYGDLSQLETIVNGNLNILSTDSNANSYAALLNRLNELNPSAKYIFMTVYNPYKYLWLEESTKQNNYKDGFLGPLMWCVPDDVIGETLANEIRGALYSTDIVQKLFKRVNGLGDWAETYINRLNQILKDKVGKYSNVSVADSKLVFESVPDRTISANKHYNDLVSVEFTRGFVVEDMDWGQFWSNVDWWSVLTNINNIANTMIENIIVNVIVPDVDPHPEAYGHEVLKRAFDERLGWRSLVRYILKYGAGDHGAGTMATQEVAGLENPVFALVKSNAFTAATEGYYFNGWNNATYANGYYYIWLNANTTINAQWSNIYTVTYKHTNHTNGTYGPNETGHKECYALWIDGAEMPKFGKFSEGSETEYRLPYGTPIGVVVKNYNPSEITYDDATCDVYWNGSSVASGYRGTTYDFILTRNTIIDFRWKIAGSLVTFDAKSWEDCYITTY